MEYVIRGERETEEFGRSLAEKLEAGDVLALIGDLGTGKTTLTKSIAKGLGIEEMITSPTFTIVSEYFSGRLPLFHFDVYRLSGEDEAFEAGLEEYFDRGGICVIEWADIIEGLLPENTKYIFLEYGKAEGERVCKCSF
jgi:hydrolase, P-loop family